MAIAPQRTIIGIRRRFTTEGVHPYDQVHWERRDARIVNFRDGTVAFEQLGVEVPESWSVNATNILAQKYFRGTLGEPDREWSLKQVVDRVVDTITEWGTRDGYFENTEEASVFSDELKYLIIHQKAAFNSPVWFNIGVKGVPQQGSACFILAVEDSMDSILNWYTEEGTIFKGGSGSGVNLSKIRSSNEPLKGGGTASGPVSFMRGADASAGTIKSGGKCYREGTLVSTPKGMRPIEQLRIGDFVHTHLGPRRVQDFMENGMKQCYLVSTKEGYQVEVTKGHKFAFWNSDEGSFDVKPIEDFELGDDLFALTEPLRGGVTISLVSPQLLALSNQTITGLDLPSELDARLGYVLGLSFGDIDHSVSHLGTFQVGFRGGEASRRSRQRFYQCCSELFGDVPQLLSEHLGCQFLGYESKRLSEFLSANGLLQAKATTLGFPSLLHQGTREVKAAFLAGVIDACCSKQHDGALSIASKDREFLSNIQLLLISQGIASQLATSSGHGSSPEVNFLLTVSGQKFVDRLCDLISDFSEVPKSLSPISGIDSSSPPSFPYRRSLSPISPCANKGDLGSLDANSTAAVATLTRDFESGPDSFTKVQLTLASVRPTEVAKTYDIEVEEAHLLCANGIYASNTRRAAKMVILDVDHPDIEDFIWCKAIEERKARVLSDAGFDMDLDGKDSHSTQYQNANNSVRVTDEFMQAVVDGRNWDLTARTDGRPVRTVAARDLFRQFAHAAWECADPGMQFDTTINRWHTASNTGRINGSNPCSEYMHLDNSACNLASLNLLTFLNDDDSFDIEGFKSGVEAIFTAQEIIVGNADYPTEKIAENSRKFRELGIGYANLGALLMACGLPYDSEQGRASAAAITALMTGHAYAVSAKTAARMGPFAGFHENSEPMLNVLRMHQAETAHINEELVATDLLSAAQASWDEAVELAEQYGVRNSQASVLAPTGCLVGDSLISTDRGLVRLNALGDPEGSTWQDLNLQVATDEGNRRATKFFINGLEPVVNVETVRGYLIQGTTTHRIKVVDQDSGEWFWKRFADLGAGDLLALKLGSMIGEPCSVKLASLEACNEFSNKAGCQEHSVPVEMDAALAELVGYYLGSGSIDRRGIRFSVAIEDFDVQERVCLLVKEVTGIFPDVVSKKTKRDVRINSSMWAAWWVANGFAVCSKGSKTRIPDAVLAANDQVVYTSFLRGLYEALGDGAAGYPMLRADSPTLLHEVQTMLLALGIASSSSIQDCLGGRSGRGGPNSTLRMLNASYDAKWLEEIGFMGDRKNANVSIPEPGTAQAGRRDYVPITHELLNQLLPRDAHLTACQMKLRDEVSIAIAQGRVTRSMAEELREATGNENVAHLLGFLYVPVVSAQLGTEEFTYDLSVPQNVTYIANGFVSHNTIGLLMDCDTTGVEPDLGLVKMKKLVGGGTMSIVNQTVPRALRQLGYGPTQVDDIISYIDEHKTILGAPHLSADHLEVFACSMGDNTIHYVGHVKMMGAVQPFISGAISKTVNMPEDVTVEDIEQLHIDAWQLGIKAVAIYRDNCKVAQPLSTAKKDGVAEGGDDAPPGSEAEARDRELASRIVELEEALEHEQQRKAADPVVIGTLRERMPRHRRSKTFAFRVADCEGYVTVGEYEDGRPGEVFIMVSKQGSTLAGIMNAFSISISLGLQHGVPLATYVRKYSNMKFEPAGITDDPDVRIATSLIDYIIRRIALDYLPYEERLELGVLSTSERTQPTLPGVEESATQTVGLNGGSYAPISKLPTPRTDYSASRVVGKGPLGSTQQSGDGMKERASAPKARAEQLDAPYCYSCGNVMQRAGSCYVCGSCGSTSGCS